MMLPKEVIEASCSHSGTLNVKAFMETSDLSDEPRRLRRVFHRLDRRDARGRGCGDAVRAAERGRASATAPRRLSG